MIDETGQTASLSQSQSILGHNLVPAQRGERREIMPMQRVLSIGQCGADHAAIARTIGRQFGAKIVSADTADEALAELRQGTFALVLVNRVLDADGSSGVDVVKRLKTEEGLQDVPVMLVSNHEDSQCQAVQAGAAPGFGKAALGQPQMIGRLTPFLRRTESAGP
jgi:two-component system, chemotaxis family, chemotaxis protein CheY